jgi:predicted metalloprotease with PDZ domain
MFPVELFKDANSKALINISWDSVPNNGIFHSSFGKEKNQLIKVTQEELYASFFVGGDFRRYQFDYKNKPIYFVTRGDWKSISDQEVLKILEETVKAQYQFWDDTIQTQFSVSLIPTTEEKAYSIGGSGLTDSFISFASNNPATTNQRLTWLYNHELMHKWLGRTILNENEVEQYWFSEGFTDYYAYKLMLKSNNLTLKEFVDIINKEIIIPHHQDKVATTPNGEITFEKYWSNYATYAKLPYRRGLLYAFLLDTQIKQQSNFTKSLDNLMLSLYDKALKDSSFRINSDTFKNELSTYLSDDALKNFEKYIINGELIDFKEQLLEGMRITQQQGIPVFSVNQKYTQQLLKQLKQ